MAGSSDQPFLIRDVFNPKNVKELATAIHHTWPSFNQKGFCDEVIPELPNLGFNDRHILITNALYTHLPESFPKAVEILLASLGPEHTTTDLTGYDGFIVLPQTNYVARFGLEHFDLSIQALYEMTKRFSSEGAIRTFIIEFPEKTLSKLREWTQDPNPHVRRLVSEGTRPRLPWTQQLTAFMNDPSPTLPLLDALKDDPELYVRRSVANHINDIAKDHPDKAAEILETWSPDASTDRQWLIRHAARTLLKQAHPKALKLLGFDPPKSLSIERFSVTPKAIKEGEEIKLDLTLSSASSQRLMIDYVMHFMKANGKQAPKVFKWGIKTPKKGEHLTLEKRHSFKPISTRKYYAGPHKIDLQINGKRLSEVRFMLE